MRAKICKTCGKKFTPDRQLQSCCTWECALERNKILQTQKKRKAIKQFKDSDVATLKRVAQTVVNAYIRQRDGKVCISCGYVGDGRQFHAGHYLPMGNNSMLRYHEDNIHSQCSICNNHLSGNLVEYRKNLIGKLGLEKVEWLESNRGTKKWSVEELKEIISTFRLKLKEKVL